MEKNNSTFTVVGFDKPQSKCSDCKGKGYYVGAFGSRDCPDCGGFGHVNAKEPANEL